MMRRRMVGRSIARAAVGTAVIAGTAGAVHHAQNQHWANKEAEQQAAYDQAYQQGTYDAQQSQQQQPQYPPQQYAPPPQQYAVPAPAQDDLTAKLQQLAELHSTGVLTDEEFSAAKQKLLAG
jgi:putative oligomerization/nucleic acid binding protein